MMQPIFRLYLWVSIVFGVGIGLLADDQGFSELARSMAYWIFPPHFASGAFAEYLVWPAAAFAWLVPASTYAPEMFGAAFAVAVGGVFLLSCVGALVQISTSPLSIWLGMAGAFDDR